MRRPRTLSPTLPTLLLAGLAGCGGGAIDDAGLPGSGGGRSAAGETIVIDGSSTVFRINRVAQEAFDQVEPSARVVVNKSGTGGGFGKYAQGEVDIVGASRPAKKEEEEKAKAAGHDWTRFLIAYDGITVAVNSKNDFVKSLSVPQLKALFEAGSKVRTWQDLDPSWPARKVILYSPDNDSGTYDFFVEEVLGKGVAQREDVQASSDDNTLVNGVAGDADGIGYFGYAYYAANANKLRAVAIRKDDASEPVAPSPETILDKSYSPLSRPLYIYVKEAILARPLASRFVKFYIENAGELATRAKYVPPTDEDGAANRRALESAPAGTTQPAT